MSAAFNALRRLEWESGSGCGNASKPCSHRVQEIIPCRDASRVHRTPCLHRVQEIITRRNGSRAVLARLTGDAG
jgi:hypothetical protein